MGITLYRISPNIRLLFNRNEKVYFDTGFILYCFIDNDSIRPEERQLFRLAKSLLLGLLQQKIPVIISTLAFDEIWYTYLKLLYERDNGKGTWKAGKKLKDKPNIILNYRTELEELQKKILKYPYLRVVGVSEISVEPAFRNMLDYKLSPRDSFHIAVCCFEETKCFITADRDFSSVPADCKNINLKIYRI